jgi:hypothetical protein
MPIRKLSTSTKVDDEHRKLARQQQELKKIEARLQKELVRMPKEIEKKKRLEKIQLAAAAAPTVSLGGARSHRDKTRAPLKGGRLRSQINGERIKFLVLCLILATILVMLWRAVPS